MIYKHLAALRPGQDLLIELWRQDARGAVWLGKLYICACGHREEQGVSGNFAVDVDHELVAKLFNPRDPVRGTVASETPAYLCQFSTQISIDHLPFFNPER